MTRTLLAQWIVAILAVFAVAAVGAVWHGLELWQSVLATGLTLSALGAALYHSYRFGSKRAALQAIATNGAAAGGRAEPCVHDACELNRLRQSLEAQESERILALQHTVDELSGCPVVRTICAHRSAR